MENVTLGNLGEISAREAMTAIYIGYYNRAPDPAGLDFWVDDFVAGLISLEDIATDFATQDETAAIYDIFADPASADAAAITGFLNDVYLNLFNRPIDQEGIDFWVPIMTASVAGDPGSMSVGGIILEILKGAKDTADGQDLTTLQNKIVVGLDWSEAARTDADLDYENNADAKAAAAASIDGVTDDQASVAAAKAATADFFKPAPVPGEEFLLTSATDVISGTENDDQFNAYLQQNPFAGGVSNSLSSADRLDGGLGEDSLYAELTFEVLGVSQLGVTDVQPRIQQIENLAFEARDQNEYNDDYFAFDINDEFNDDDLGIIVDAKNITDVVKIGSYMSDGDLKIENLTTLTNNGNVRNTSDITVTMDHTDNFNTDADASDLSVLFDNDYLISGQTSVGEVRYFLLDEDAELAGLTDRLNNIDVDGLRFNITNPDGSVTAVNIEDIEANLAGTHQGFVNALQPALQALIADGTLPAGTTLTLDPTMTDTTFLDDGSESAPIPAIVLKSGDGSEVIATGFSRIQEEIGEYDVYGRFESQNETSDEPISVHIDLYKVGRGGEGGYLEVGGKADYPNTDEGFAGGIEVFHIDVLGAGDDDPTGAPNKGSNVEWIDSTDDALDKVFINTAEEFLGGATHASLTVRRGFNDDMELVNADGFLGNLTLGNESRIDNLHTLTAQGGGDVWFRGEVSDDDQFFSYTTGGGDDFIDLEINGDATDFAGSGVNIHTAGGDDEVILRSDYNDGSDFDTNDQRLNQKILANINIETGDGDDMIEMAADYEGDAHIDAGNGADFINTSGSNDYAGWVFNFDDERWDDSSDLSDDDVPGVPTSLAYIGGATVTVTLSGAGDWPTDVLDGGGVMAFDPAMPTMNGYEASATVTVAGPNQFFGTQVDVNNAVIAAITGDPILSKLIELELTENNTWVARMTTGGDFDPEDLRIDIKQRDQGDEANDWNGVEAEARSVFSNSSIVIADLDDANGGSPSTAFLPDLSETYIGGDDDDDDDGTNAWYTGLSAYGDEDNAADNTQYERGDNGYIEQDNVINGGSNDAADDLIVMSTDEYNGDPEDTTFLPGNTLHNYASNETIVMEGNFGDDTIMNFTVMEPEEEVVTSEPAFEEFTMPSEGPVDPGTRDGLDFLDFTSYLTSQYDRSENPPGVDSSDSNVPIPVTLDEDADDVEANEVSVVQAFVASGSDSWGGLTASVVEELFNNSDNSGDYGNLDDDVFTVVEYDKTDQEDLIGNAKAIVMIENAANLGEYKVFELTWDGDANDDDDPVVSATQVGSLDFGTSLISEDNQLHEINLVGSDDYAYLIENGFTN